MSLQNPKPWKSVLQEYCQKNKLQTPNYRSKQQESASHEIRFQSEVEVNESWITGEGNFTSKKDAENSAAQIAYNELCKNKTEIGVAEVDHSPNEHMPKEYESIENYLANILGSFGGRIRKVRSPDAYGRYRLEIGGNYRYCDNVGRPHKKNQVYFLVDPVNLVYYQRCYDPDCQGFQSAKQPIHIKETKN
ncbi:unnamed protein product [Adineta steineri]|uniref:DNA-directed primase/polymerase protein n=1 Tax=Adineta steineri TaxID=433720 RepID=A0A819LW51_9BILA|nr:unnamed protein product [Adineta steineri]CAF1294158.1 unnamed protein product [Adineta steineri]CAF3856096.1 unnamed protein product [Adineta steineri]CAF3967849.1 unnamed protein product [Adineta steineri]